MTEATQQSIFGQKHRVQSVYEWYENHVPERVADHGLTARVTWIKNQVRVFEQSTGLDATTTPAAHLGRL